MAGGFATTKAAEDWPHSKTWRKSGQFRTARQRPEVRPVLCRFLAWTQPPRLQPPVPRPRPPTAIELAIREKKVRPHDPLPHRNDSIVKSPPSPQPSPPGEGGPFGRLLTAIPFGDSSPPRCEWAKRRAVCGASVVCGGMQPNCSGPGEGEPSCISKMIHRSVKEQGLGKSAQAAFPTG